MIPVFAILGRTVQRPNEALHWCAGETVLWRQGGFMNVDGGRVVLCGANHYTRKYYFNEQFAILPQRIKDELQILCVTFTEKCGGIMTLAFDENGHLKITTEAEEMDAMYDDINAGLEIKKIREEKRELFESLELFYKIFAGGGP